MPGATESLLTQVGAFVGGLIGGAAAAWAHGRKSRGVFGAARGQRDAFSAGVRAQTAMVDMVQALQCKRVVLLATDVEKRISTVVGEAHLFGAPSAAKQWKDTPVEPWYAAMVNGLQRNAPQELRTEDLSPGLLRDIYTTSGISMSLVFLVERRGGRVVYVSANYGEEAGDVSSEQRVAVTEAVNQLRGALPAQLLR